ncbi:MAG: triosephosphate isomerase [Patescibacteria group bacterium]|nr:triosephosphate isomerase [Patescibacteria group bacterium]
MTLLIGNWKMAPEKSTEALVLAKKTLLIAKTYKKNIQTVICVPSIHVPILTKNIKSTLFIGSQSVSSNTEIAQTGLVSAGMLKSYGATYCIVGHSESRLRGESDAEVLGSTNLILQKGLIPVICIGEKERDNHGWYLSAVKSQVETVVMGVPKAQLKKIVFAYEPIWAIGSNAAREATVAECREMIIFIRKVISDVTDIKTANSIKILYGGSVNEQNASSFVLEGGAEGLLVGRVSLDAKRFGQLAKVLSNIA